MNKVPGKIKISYVLVGIFERLLNIPKRLLKENIGILYNYDPGVRGTKTQRFVRSKQIPLVLFWNLNRRIKN